MALREDDRIEVERLIATNATMRSGLLPLLHAIQSAVGYFPDEVVGLVAQGLNLSRADVHGVLSSYHDFRRQLADDHAIKLCRSEACQAGGGDAITRQAVELCGAEMGTTAATLA